MDYSKQGHCVYYARYHLVLVTKYRRSVLDPGMGEYLKLKAKEINKYYPDVFVLEAKTDRNHLHLFVSIPPKYSVSWVVNLIKANTARAMRKQFPFLEKVYWGQAGIWSNGYFVSTAGINEETVRRYIQLQGEEDSGRAKLELP